MRTTDTRAAILELTRTILRNEGMAAITMRRLAKELGLSAMAPYKHFASREALLYEVARQEIGQMLPYLERHIEGIEDPVEILRETPRAYALWAMSHPDAYPFLVPSGFSGTLSMHHRILAQDSDPGHRPGLPAFHLLVEIVKGALMPLDDACLEGIVLEAWQICAGLAALAMPIPFQYGGPGGILDRAMADGAYWTVIDTWILGLEARGLLRKPAAPSRDGTRIRRTPPPTREAGPGPHRKPPRAPSPEAGREP